MDNGVAALGLGIVRVLLGKWYFNWKKKMARINRGPIRGRNIPERGKSGAKAIQAGISTCVDHRLVRSQEVWEEAGKLDRARTHWALESRMRGVGLILNMLWNFWKRFKQKSGVIWLMFLKHMKNMLLYEE